MRIPSGHWLKTTPIAHRGLWGGDIVENGITAYENAVKGGYAVEIDVYLSADGELFSFHDKRLKRMTSVDGLIYEKSSAQIKALRLNGGREKIPTFKEVLDVCAKRAPLLIEIKNQPDKSVVKRVVDVLKDYSGEFAIQSFNPFYMREVKRLAPEFLRGILTTSHEEHLKNESAVTKYVIKNMPFNRLVEPDFISCYYGSLPLKPKKAKDKAVLAWTVTDNNTANALNGLADNIIFELFTPDK